ncbi:MAG: hypothetical protein AB7S77_03085 [Desulfatirhabdiaceae bacterium]
MNPIRFLMVILLLVWSGCVSSVHVEKGNQSYQSKNYIQAAEYYERALQEEPDSSDRDDVREKLEKAKVLITDDVIGRYGVITLSDRNNLNRIDFQIEKIREVVKWDDRQQRMKQEIDRLKQTREKAVADRNAKNQEFEQLIQTLNRKIAGFDMAGAQKTFEQAGSTGVISPKIDSYNDLINKLIRLMNEYNKSLSSGNADNAIANLMAYKTLSPDPVEFDRAPNREYLIKLLDDEFTRLISNNKWRAALEKLSSIPISELKEKYAFIRIDGSDYYYKKAQEAQNNSQINLAYLYAVQSAILDESNFNNHLLLRDTQDFVEKSIHRNIAISTFESPSTDIDSGRQCSESLISLLYKSLPYGINILEREKIDMILKEHKDQKESEVAQNILNADLIISGSVSLFNVESTIEKRNSTARVVVGEDISENPEFTQMVKTMGADTSKWPSVPPKTIKTPRYEVVGYTKGTGKLKGFAKATVRVFNTRKGTIEFIKEFDSNVEYASEFQDEVKDAGIESKAMKLPTETEIKVTLRNDLVGQIGAVINKLFENQENRFYTQANMYMDRQEIENSHQPLAQGYFYCVKEKLLDSKEVCKKIDGLVRQVIE